MAESRGIPAAKRRREKGHSYQMRTGGRQRLRRLAANKSGAKMEDDLAAVKVEGGKEDMNSKDGI
jgi:hypothetical protein